MRCRLCQAQGDCSMGGTLSGDEGGQCCARIKFGNLTVAAALEEQ